MYLQILLELGVVGAIVMGTLISTIAVTVRRKVADLRRCGAATFEYGVFAYAVCCAIAIHGVAESSTILGTTANSFIIGLAVGLIDRVHAVTAAQMLEQHTIIQIASSPVIGACPPK
jgi:O-antigen ligase